MEAIDKVISYKRRDSFYLYLIGDLHLGTVHCAENEIRKKVAEIKDNPNALWIGMGDMAECITPSDKRWDPSALVIPDWVKHDDIAKCQSDKVIEFLSPIKDKCVGLLYGNHEDSIRKRNHDNIHKWICDGLELPNLGYSAFVHFIFRRRGSKEAHLVKGAFTHGTGGARTEGGKINYLTRFMRDFDANIYGYAHTHNIQLHSPDILGTTENLAIKAKGKIGALTGCWFRTYTQGGVASYGEMKVYSPTRIGCPVFIITPDKGMVEAKAPPVMY